MLRLSDGQLQTLMSLGKEIPQHLRKAWLESIASSLGNRPDFNDKDIWTVAMHAKGTVMKKLEQAESTRPGAGHAARGLCAATGRVGTRSPFEIYC
jgi:hypothetical protein